MLGRLEDLGQDLFRACELLYMQVGHTDYMSSRKVKLYSGGGLD